MIYEKYKEREQISQQKIQQLTKTININSIARLFVIIIGGAALFYSFQTNSIVLVVGLVLLIVFLFVLLISRQSKLEKQRDAEKAFLDVNENELSIRVDRKNMYDSGSEFEFTGHPYTSDLDVFGEYSLFAIVNRCGTLLGVRQLASWFQHASAKDIVEKRQQAISEIAEDLEWSQSLQAKLVFNLRQKSDVKVFLSNYFNHVHGSFGNRFMDIYVRIAPFLLLLGVLYAMFIAPIWPIVTGLALVHLFWTIALAGKVAMFSGRTEKVGRTLASYAEALKLIEDKIFLSSRNKELQQHLRSGERMLSSVFLELSSLINSLDARNNMLVGAVLNMIFLWDFKYVLKIVKWKSRHQNTILVAFDIIAEYEAINSLAILKRNNPDWVVPVLLENPSIDKMYARHLGHPLISTDYSVRNDYTNEHHEIALITGSNMAGKSTFLRTVGLNAVLAYAGGVCCGSEFRLPIYKLITYMRIKDSLNESTSTFKAELDRMKFILETVAADTNSFFLIDEMLRGTNSVDKYLGSRAVIRKLIVMQGKGMVATHDLQLASLEEENFEKVKNYHFDIQVQDGEMLFDYKLKEGKCTVFNASMLLRGIGIDVEDEN